MAEIGTRFGSGGAGLVPGKSGGTPTLAQALRDIATDLAAINGAVGGGTAITAEITAAALPAFTDPPTAAEMAALRTLVNQLRTAVIELIGAVEGGVGGGPGITLLTTAP